jgi:hypothetical protein
MEVIQAQWSNLESWHYVGAYLRPSWVDASPSVDL